jgi:hypothetical protein
VAPLHRDSGRRHIADLDRVVLASRDGVCEILAHLLGVHVERGHEFHIGDVVRTELDVHQTRNVGVLVGVGVVLHALDQR